MEASMIYYPSDVKRISSGKLTEKQSEELFEEIEAGIRCAMVDGAHEFIKATLIEKGIINK